MVPDGMHPAVRRYVWMVIHVVDDVVGDHVGVGRLWCERGIGGGDEVGFGGGCRLRGEEGVVGVGVGWDRGEVVVAWLGWLLLVVDWVVGFVVGWSWSCCKVDEINEWILSRLMLWVLRRSIFKRTHKAL